MNPLVFIICGSMMISGCSSTSELRGGARETLPPDRHLRFTFSDGGTVETGPFHYALVREPDDFICGTGTRVSKVTGKSAGFEGKIVPLSFDQTGGFNTFSISDSEYVRFHPGDYVVVRKSAGVGLFYASRSLGPAPDSSYTWRKSFDDIRLIEESSISVWKTASLSAAILVVVGAIAVATALSDFKLNFSPKGGAGWD